MLCSDSARRARPRWGAKNLEFRAIAKAPKAVIDQSGLRPAFLHAIAGRGQRRCPKVRLADRSGGAMDRGHKGLAFFAYSDNYLMDVQFGVIVDVEASPFARPRSARRESSGQKSASVSSGSGLWPIPRWDDGRIEFDNSPIERSMRPITVTRKNALFAGSDGGAEHYAVIASLIETCKPHDVEPLA